MLKLIYSTDSKRILFAYSLCFTVRIAHLHTHLVDDHRHTDCVSVTVCVWACIGWMAYGPYGLLLWVQFSASPFSSYGLRTIVFVYALFFRAVCRRRCRFAADFFFCLLQHLLEWPPPLAVATIRLQRADCSRNRRRRDDSTKTNRYYHIL